MTADACDPRVLGVLCVMHSTFHAMPRADQLGAMLARGLEQVPGVGRARAHLLDEPAAFARLSAPVGQVVRRYAVTTRALGFGEVYLELDESGAYQPYEPFVRNLLGAVATEMLARAQRAEIERANAELRAARDELEEASSQKDEFLAMLGHELRNPLAAILNAVQVQELAGPPDDPRTAATRQVIARQTRNMARMLDDLLDVSRIARGKIQIDRAELDLAHVVAEVAGDFAPRAAQAEVALITAVAEAPLSIVGDRTRLAQVVGNLIDNALKFTPAGGHVQVRAYADGPRAVVEISDDGEGVSPELLPGLFAPFRQAPQPLSRRAGGLGLGLAIVEMIAELHGGSASAHSDGEGTGATFRVELPLAEAT